VGAVAPHLTLNSAAGQVDVPHREGRPVLLVFFQEAGTPTCTTQVASVVQEEETIAELGAVAICVSTDPLEQQRAFAASLGTTRIVLASDPDGSAARAYGVYDEVARRARRAAFVVSGQGTVLLALPWYNPLNSDQLAQLFLQLGLGDGAEDTNDG